MMASTTSESEFRRTTQRTLTQDASILYMAAKPHGKHTQFFCILMFTGSVNQSLMARGTLSLAEAILMEMESLTC